MRKLFIPIILCGLVAGSCGGEKGADENRKAASVPREISSVRELEIDSVGDWATYYDFAPESGEPIVTYWNYGSYAEVFNDSNYVHWRDAEKIGLKPITQMRDHYQTRRPLVKVVCNEDFWVDTLTHSKPYLVPEGAAALHEIGRRFRDTLAARGGGEYRIKVTSVTRTADNVRRLRRSNRNAVDSSVHQLGTTFDISWASFIRDSETTPARGGADLKKVLAEVLYAMRDEGKIWVKYERHQPCFHVSAR